MADSLNLNSGINIGLASGAATGLALTPVDNTSVHFNRHTPSFQITFNRPITAGMYSNVGRKTLSHLTFFAAFGAASPYFPTPIAAAIGGAVEGAATGKGRIHKVVPRTVFWPIYMSTKDTPITPVGAAVLAERAGRLAELALTRGSVRDFFYGYARTLPRVVVAGVAIDAAMKYQK